MSRREDSVKICFLSSARYGEPLDTTNEKKFLALKSLGELFVVGFSKDFRPRRFTEHARFYLLPKLPIPILRYATIFMVGSPLVLWLIFRHHVQVLVAQSPYEGFTAACAKKIAGWLGKRVVLVVESHGDFQESLFLYRRVLLQKTYRFLMRFVASFSLRHADLLRAVSNSTKEQLERQSPGKQIVRFPAWTDIEVFRQVEMNGEKNSSQSILYAGVLSPLKGVHHLLNAFVCLSKEFPQARLLLVEHEENKDYAAELKAQIKRSDLDGRVQFLGVVLQEELAVSMRKACVFALPSALEGLPRVVIEAMATGTPVIGSNVGGIPEIVEDGTTGFLVHPGDETALTERIRWVLKNPEKAREMGARARGFAEKIFSTDIYIGGYRQILEVAQGLSAEEDDHAPSTL